MFRYVTERSPRLFLCATLAMLFFTCVPPSEEIYEGIVVDLNDPVARQIYEHQNARNADSLVAYLTNANPSYRYLATRAFGSFASLPQPAREALIVNLGDRYELVRSAAAYAIGQAAGETALSPLSSAFDTLGDMTEYNATLLAAIGKIGSEETQTQVTSITTYGPRDTTLRAAQVQSLLYFARRGIRSPAGDSIALSRVLEEDTPLQVRTPAAYYLQRFPVAITEAEESRLRDRFRSETDADILMAIARTLGAAGYPPSLVALTRKLRSAMDWRVRIEVVKALAKYEYALVRPTVLETLNDEHPLVRKQAADFLLDRGQPTDAAFYHRFAKDSTRADIRYVLYGAANRHLPSYLTDYRGRINYDLQQAFSSTEDVYQRADILLSLAEFAWNYRTIHDLYREAGSPVVRSAAAEALYRISSREDFDAYFRASAGRVRLDLAGYFQEMVTSLAVGPAYHAANAIAERPEVYGPLYPDRTWLRAALNAFKLPREIEAYYAVDAARAALAGEPAPAQPTPGTGTREIDWNLLGEGGKDVLVKTSAGRFTLRLFPDLAPATVSNFLQLMGEGYYNGKVFHRVVPNFVAQGGGPLGDGFGAEDFAVRTETPGIRWDRPGLVGMASAGRDTEGVQFFITHRAAPHLDGNYTIFAEVIEGQEVVGRITVGTVIESVTRR